MCECVCLQCSKLLIDTKVIQFYPSKFVLITDILDNFGEFTGQYTGSILSWRPHPQGTWCMIGFDASQHFFLLGPASL